MFYISLQQRDELVHVQSININSNTLLPMLRLITAFLMAGTLLVACGGSESTEAVESGTYTGTVNEVVPEESEIYVETEDGKELELYFVEKTTLTHRGDTVDFSALQTGQQVEVTVEKVGKRLDPLSVRILD
jgi:CspA family cold shock protein